MKTVARVTARLISIRRYLTMVNPTTNKKKKIEIKPSG